MDQVVTELENTYPGFVASVRALVFFDYKVEQRFEREFGAATLDNIIITNDYNTYLDNVHHGQNDGSNLARLAGKRRYLFGVQTKEAHKVARKVGFATTVHYLDLLRVYFKQIAGITAL
jgi:hypothetical protein